ncbi:MAG: hypothetical protein WCG93_08755 [Paludibacter sp.]
MLVVLCRSLKSDASNRLKRLDAKSAQPLQAVCRMNTRQLLLNTILEFIQYNLKTLLLKLY